jgi:plastocyanin
MLPHLLAVIALAAAAACAATSAAAADNVTLAVRVATPDGLPVEDAVVVAAPADGALPATGRARAEHIDQVDKEFVPRVKPVLAGSTMTFPNRDTVRHHVYSFSPAKRFELPLYTGTATQSVTFDKPGVVVLGCNIHDWMIGYVYVSESPWFAKTGADGKAALTDLPPRAYIVRVWHPLATEPEEATRQAVDLARTGRAEATFTITLKREVRVRRAPVGGHGTHY